VVKRRIELQGTCTGNVLKFGHVVFEICERADRQTDRHSHRNTSHSSDRLHAHKPYVVMERVTEAMQDATWTTRLFVCRPRCAALRPRLSIGQTNQLNRKATVINCEGSVIGIIPWVGKIDELSVGRRQRAVE